MVHVHVFYFLNVKSKANNGSKMLKQIQGKQLWAGSLSTDFAFTTTYFSSSVWDRAQGVNAATKHMQKCYVLGPPLAFRLFQIPCSWYSCLRSQQSQHKRQNRGSVDRPQRLEPLWGLRNGVSKKRIRILPLFHVVLLCWPKWLKPRYSMLHSKETFMYLAGRSFLVFPF